MEEKNHEQEGGGSGGGGVGVDDIHTWICLIVRICRHILVAEGNHDARTWPSLYLQNVSRMIGSLGILQVEKRRRWFAFKTCCLPRESS
ncbi:hypothetical protein CHS0354_029135, partial [Potamilus streckersoni]